MFRPTLSRFTAASFACIALSIPAAVRAEVTLTPFAGPYVATTRMAADLTSTGFLQVKPMTGMGVGLTWRHSPRLAGEAVLGYARGELEVFSGSDAFTLDAAVVNTDALIRWSLTEGDSPARWELIVGAGSHRLRGTLSDLLRKGGQSGSARTRLGVIAGLGASWKVGDGLALRLEGQDHMHGSGLELSSATSGIQTTRAVQHDVSMTLGVAFPVRR